MKSLPSPRIRSLHPGSPPVGRFPGPLACLAVAAVCLTPLSAAPVTLVDAGFETQPANTEFPTETLLPDAGWWRDATLQSGSNTGMLYIADSGAADGAQTALLGYPPELRSLQQSVSTPFASGTDYTLTVFGRAISYGSFAANTDVGMKLTIYRDDNFAIIHEASFTVLKGADGDRTLTVTAAAVAAAGATGKNIGIRITKSALSAIPGNDGGKIELRIDKVRLEATSAAPALVWDTNLGMTDAQDGVGTWAANGPGWWNGATNVNFTQGEKVSFGANTAAAGTVTVSGTVQTPELTFFPAGSGTYTLASQDAAGIIHLNGATNAITTYANATITAQLLRTTALAKRGPGTLAFTGANATNDGPITLSQGTLGFNHADSLGGVAANTITLGDADTGSSVITLSRTAAVSLANNLVVAVSGAGEVKIGTSNATTQANYTGTLSLNRSVTLFNDNTGGVASNYTGAITGTGDITISGASFTRFNQASTKNTFVGNVILKNSARLQLGAVSGPIKFIPQTAVIEFASANTTLGFSNNGETVRGLSSTGAAGSRTVTTSFGVASATATLTTAVPAGGSYSFTGILTEQAPAGAAVYKLNYTKSGLGTQILSGVSTYSGSTLVSGGTLALSGAGTLTTTPSIDVQAGGTFDVSARTSVWNLGAAQTLKGKGTLIGNATTAGKVAPGTATSTLTANGNFTFTGGSSLDIVMQDLAGVAQVETAAVVGTATAAGEVVVTVTGAGIVGSPVVVNVPVLTGDAPSAIAALIDAALNNSAAVVALYTVGGTANTVTLTRKEPAANDVTLNIAIANGDPDPGITPAPTSANTLTGSLGQGIASSLAVSGSLAVNGATLNLTPSGPLNSAVYVIASYGTRTGTFSSVTGLPDGYLIDYAYAGNSIAVRQGVNPDTTPPAWVSGWPLVNAATSSGFTARAEADEAGTAYFVVIADHAVAPTAAQIKAGQDGTGASALKSGSLAVTAGIEATAPVTGLTPATDYDVWWVAEDLVPNLQASPVMVDAATLSILTPFAEWIAGFSVGGLTGLTDDPDQDGKPNFAEFALNSNPADASSLGGVFTRLATVGGTPGVLTLTLAVRDGAVFEALANSQRAEVATDSLTYLIEAANTLADWQAPVVSEVTGPDADAIRSSLTPAAPGSGWTYHTFRSDGSSATDSGDFLRVKITTP